MGVQAEAMAKDDTSSVLRRKAQSGREVHQARAMSIPKALRLTVAKLADQMFNMAMSVIGVTREVVQGGGIGALFDQPALLTLLDGPDRRTGAAILDTVLVGGLIQQQTMGTVLPAPEGAEPRAMTPTDASLCAPFLDALIERAALLPEDEADRALIAGFRFGARAEDSRILQLALEAQEYEVIRLTLDLAGGKRQGSMALVFPLGKKPVIDLATADEPPGLTDVVPKPTLADIVMGLEAEVSVALTRLRLPLARLGGLNVGDTLDLGVSGLDNALVMNADGRLMSRGRLGLSNGFRAVQLAAEKPSGQQPQRRASDRAQVDQPPFDAHYTQDTIDMPASLDIGNDLSELPDLSEFSDLPDIDGLADLPDFGEMPDMSDLPELSDLPPFDSDLED